MGSGTVEVIRGSFSPEFDLAVDGDGNGTSTGTGLVIVARAQLPDRYADDRRTFALWRSQMDGTPANGGSGTQARVGLIEEVQGPLELCTARALHGTLKPEKWKGERLWIVALEGKVVGDAEKMGALKREIIAEVKC